MVIKPIFALLSLFTNLFVMIGIIALWDFETGKLEGILKADDNEVT
jgi:hypothetical protein